MCLLIVLLLITFCQCQVDIKNQGRDYWYENARTAIEKRLPTSKMSGQNTIKNVVMFIGDGMGLSTLTAARILKGQRRGNPGEESELIWESFPAVALSKTYNADAQIGESSACATALMCGVKANYETLGVDSSVQFGDCPNSFQGKVPSLLAWAQKQGKRTGIVTNSRITHATPAALYAHSPSRYWEDDSKVKISDRVKCKDIARQLIEDEPGKHFNVIFGGGRRHFTSVATLDPETPYKEGKRLDGRNLIEDWIRDKHHNTLRANYVMNQEELLSVDAKETDYVLGLFAASHMDFETERDTSPTGDPSLTEMTLKALEILQKPGQNYFLVVEGGRIDHAHHFNNAYRALDETLSLEQSVSAALKNVNLTDTLLLVTADHSHVMTLGGYATTRGNSIFGYDRRPSDVDQKAYTTLLYANGPGGIGRSRKLRSIKQSHRDAIQQAAIPRNWATHAGEDVPVYAIGPLAKELFSGTFDQSYIPHAIAYGSCMQNFKTNCQRSINKSEKYFPQDHSIIVNKVDYSRGINRNLQLKRQDENKKNNHKTTANRGHTQYNLLNVILFDCTLFFFINFITNKKTK